MLQITLYGWQGGRVKAVNYITGMPRALKTKFCKLSNFLIAFSLLLIGFNVGYYTSPDTDCPVKPADKADHTVTVIIPFIVPTIAIYVWQILKHHMK